MSWGGLASFEEIRRDGKVTNFSRKHFCLKNLPRRKFFQFNFANSAECSTVIGLIFNRLELTAASS